MKWIVENYHRLTASYRSEILNKDTEMDIFVMQWQGN
jgi:hypothetical protein